MGDPSAPDPNRDVEAASAAARMMGRHGRGRVNWFLLLLCCCARLGGGVDKIGGGTGSRFVHSFPGHFPRVQSLADVAELEIADGPESRTPSRPASPPSSAGGFSQLAMLRPGSREDGLSTEAMSDDGTEFAVCVGGLVVALPVR